MNKPVVLVRGAGEQASGVGWTLVKAGFNVVMTEVANPLMVRWPVCFGTAVAEGRWQVEGISARRVEDPEGCEAAWSAGEIPVLVDPHLECLPTIKPAVLVDAIMAKRNLGTKRNMALWTIGLGPGFRAGVDVDIVIETNRGHYLGRLIYTGTAQANTGIPSEIIGLARERVIYSSMEGVFEAKRTISELVKTGECLGEINNGGQTIEVCSAIDGVLRGLLRTGTPIGAFVKIGDVDPRGHADYCRTISEKARTLGGAVLLSILESDILSPLYINPLTYTST